MGLLEGEWFLAGLVVLIYRLAISQESRTGWYTKPVTITKSAAKVSFGTLLPLPCRKVLRPFSIVLRIEQASLRSRSKPRSDLTL